uniref:Uncharacterized protein n=1 Tax=Acrobeloides nanus TaxID=290746 RepID=A0A914E9X6_9BILA
MEEKRKVKAEEEEKRKKELAEEEKKRKNLEKAEEEEKRKKELAEEKRKKVFVVNWRLFEYGMSSVWKELCERYWTRWKKRGRLKQKRSRSES